MNDATGLDISEKSKFFILNSDESDSNFILTFNSVEIERVDSY